MILLSLSIIGFILSIILLYYNARKFPAYIFLAFLIGPLNFWYIRSILTDDYRLKKRDYWHFVPALIAMVTSIPYMFTSWAEKTRVATEIINDLHSGY